MKKVILLATVSDRFDGALKTISTVREFLPEWKVVTVMQGLDAAGSQDKKDRIREASDAAIFLPDRVGPHSAKVLGIELALEVYFPAVFCSVDDDMEFTEKTDLQPCVDKCEESCVGLVSAGWVKHENAISKHRVVDEYVKQPIVYTGGGLVFSSRVAELILAIDNELYYCDNSEWSLATYTAGLENYRYRGSVTVHRVCGKGGRRAWVAETGTKPPSSDLLSMHMGGDGYLRVGNSQDLTDKAKQMHKENKGLRK